MRLFILQLFVWILLVLMEIYGAIRKGYLQCIGGIELSVLLNRGLRLKTAGIHSPA